MLKYGIHVAGAKSTGEFINVTSPYTGEVIGQVEQADSEILEKALQNAHDTFYSTMREMPVHKREFYLTKVVNLMRKNLEDLTLTIAKEGGKPYADAKIEVTRAMKTVKMSAHEAAMLDGETLRMDRAAGTENHTAYTVREPVGVVLAISAFNHPLNLICHQMATAFAAGNSVIVKPAPTTPLSCMKLADFFKEAGVPEGVISVINAKDSDMSMVVSDPRIRFVTFIGSAKVGWEYIYPKVAKGTRVALEHGGAAPSIVSQHANLDVAIPKILKGAFYHAGQVCVSTQIVHVHESLYEKVTQELGPKIEALVVGDPTSEDTEVGPLIKQGEVDRVHEWVSEAIDQGATLICGGEKLDHQCYKPTLLADVKATMSVYSKEIFGPVLCLKNYSNINAVYDEINKTQFSFQASIYTDNISEALTATRKIETKACMVNDSTAFRVDWMPFGGSKTSGLGTGGVKHSLLEMTEEKLVVINHNT